MIANIYDMSIENNIRIEKVNSNNNINNNKKNYNESNTNIDNNKDIPIGIIGISKSNNG